EGGLANPMAARLAGAAMSALPEASCPLTLALYDGNRDYLVDGEALPQPVRSGVCSKFLCFGSPNGTLFQALHRRGYPAVSLGYEVALPGVLSLVPDYAEASRTAIRHLHSLGHRQLAIVSGPFGATDAHVLELNRGVRLACDELKLPIESLRIIYGDLSDKSGRSAVEELFSKKVEPSAIFCMSDAAAAGVLTAAHVRGLKVPEQLSVIGCGDDPRALYSCPLLTTVRLPAEEIAIAGVHEIDRLVRAAVPGAPRKTIYPVTLVERESTGPVARS
ncbi:MAG TPA: substrate-binding domain-containing protein, partial [Chthoniobacteraceae bacterium]|nr:substrate-binding domain-containing protein [Chthoniobacteraceae bacterium]